MNGYFNEYRPKAPSVPSGAPVGRWHRLLGLEPAAVTLVVPGRPMGPARKIEAMRKEIR